jgi:hypothetical protein
MIIDQIKHKISNGYNLVNFGKKYTFPKAHETNLDDDHIKIIFTSGIAQKYNGGTKLYNLWVKLLRQNNLNAQIATINGKYDHWLIDHQPVISYSEIKTLQNRNYKTKICTAWLDTPKLEEVTNNRPFYYFDAELAWTLKFKKRLDYFLNRRQIAAIATHSRYIQGWYMANYGFKPTLINEWSDREIFSNEPSKRVQGRIVCMIESADDKKLVQQLSKNNHQHKLCESIQILKGSEKKIAAKMKTADIFIGLNQGKHPLWGEGCPRTQQEAMHAGCVLVAFDCLGNREYLYDQWTGIIIPKNNPTAVWETIVYLMKHKKEKENLRQEGLNLVKHLFSENNKINPILDFLQIQP